MFSRTDALTTVSWTGVDTQFDRTATGAGRRRSTSEDVEIGVGRLLRSGAQRHNCYKVLGLHPMRTMEGGKGAWTY